MDNYKISIKLDSVIFFQTESLSKTSVFINGEYFEFASGLPQNPENVILNISKFELIFIFALFSC